MYLKKIHLVFHNGFNYHCHFIKKALAKEFKNQFTCKREITEKYIIFTVPIKVTRIEKNGEKITKNMSYTLEFIDSAKFMASSLSNLVNNLYEGTHRIKCKYRHDDKKCEAYRNEYKYCDCFLRYENFKDDLIEYKCLCCDKNYQHKFDENLKEHFFNTYKFSDHDNISLFYFCEKVLILLNIRMIGKNSMKHHYLKKKIFTFT